MAYCTAPPQAGRDAGGRKPDGIMERGAGAHRKYATGNPVASIIPFLQGPLRRAARDAGGRKPDGIPPLNALQANTLIINYISKRT